MFTEDDFIQLSALQHYVYCPRQCALIHVEDAWAENVYTVRGGLLHEKVDTDTYESRGAVRTVRGLRIHSYRLGLAGRADVVEFHRQTGTPEVLLPVPVEFKAGHPKEDISDKVQLCAQALCVEEMLGTAVPYGEMFYGQIRRRLKITLDEELRRQTEEIIQAVHELVKNQRVPPARVSSKCRNCSLVDVCQPRACDNKKLEQYMTMLYQR